MARSCPSRWTNECLAALQESYKCPDVVMTETIDMFRLEAYLAGLTKAYNETDKVRRGMFNANDQYGAMKVQQAILALRDSITKLPGEE